MKNFDANQLIEIPCRKFSIETETNYYTATQSGRGCFEIRGKSP